MHYDSKLDGLQGVTLRTAYLCEKLTPYPLPTKDAGVLRTISDARAYMQSLPKSRALRAQWQHANRLLQDEVRPVALTRQVQVALFIDGKLDDGAFRHLSSARGDDMLLHHERWGYMGGLQ